MLKIECNIEYTKTFTAGTSMNVFSVNSADVLF